MRLTDIQDIPNGKSLVTGVALAVASRLNSGRPKKHHRKACVIELGTAYGEHLEMLEHCDLIQRWTSVDVMYDWVPDVRPDEPFDPAKVDLRKVLRWLECSRAMRFEHHLLVGRTHDVACDVNSPVLLGSDILIVDACHHPVEAVTADYWDYRGFLTDEHFAVFDDINVHAPRVAVEQVEGQLRDRGYTVDRRDFSGRVAVLHVVSPAGIEPATPA